MYEADFDADFDPGFDPGALAQLRADLDPPDFSDAVALYLAEGDVLAARMAHAAMPSDFLALKGVALALGLTRLAQVAGAGEAGADPKVTAPQIAALWRDGRARLDQEFGQ